jgi:hypothetical protein
MAKRLSEQLADLSVRAKSAEQAKLAVLDAVDSRMAVEEAKHRSIIATAKFSNL